MRARLIASCVVLVFCQGGTALAGKYNEKLSIGDKAPAFAALPAADGKTYASADFAKAKVLLVVFTCNSCPYAIDYEDRLIGFHKLFCEGGEVALVAINCNLIPADSLENMARRAEEKGFKFPYLFDESQKSAADFGAIRTPECYVLDQERKVVYMGAFDDAARIEQVTRKHAELAVEAALAGKAAEVAETPPLGCLIRIKRSRE
jgi:peroxiredoxin